MRDVRDNNMKRKEWFDSKWRYMKRFFIMAILGIGFLVLAEMLEIKSIAWGGVLIVPLIYWLVMVPILHWKERYKGTKSTLWGALLVIETSGWSKIVYWFVHVLPDWNQTGNYEDVE